MLYSRYIFNKTLVGFLSISAVLVVLIWFSRAISFVKYVTENGVEISQFFYLFILILPWLLLFIVPFSLFGTVILIYNRLTTSNEIAILKNSGLTKLSISRPAIILGVFLSFFCLLISFYLMPFANKELRLSRNNIRDNYTNLSFNPQTFESLKELTIYAKSRSKENQLFGILIHDERSEDYSITITARTGKIAIEDKSALLYMKEGTLQKTDVRTKKSEILDFDDYIFNLTENQKGHKESHWKAKERYLHELLYPEEEIEEYELDQFRSEIHQRFTYPLLPLIFSLIASSCILRGSFKRGGNYSNIILAIILATSFLVIALVSYDLIESSAKFIFLPYLNLVIFLIVSLRILSGNYRSKK